MKRFMILFIKLTLLGLLVGLFIAGYQFIAHEVIHYSNVLLKSEILIWVFTIISSFVLLIVLMVINKKNKGYYGGGIPQIEAYHRGWYEFSPYKMLVFMTINSLFGFFGGFLLGSEGPSISIGSSLSMILNRIFKLEDKDDVAIGGSAGFACAFSSPLAGLCHMIEENKHIISFKLIIKGIYVIGISFIISYLLYPHSLLPYLEIEMLPIKYIWLIILLSVICLIISKLFIASTIKLKDMTKGTKIMMYLTPILLVLFMMLRRYEGILIGNGIDSLDVNVIDYSLAIILCIFIFRFIGTVFSLNSNMSGGLVLPTLAIGSLTGIILVKVLSYFIPEITNYTYIFIICGMLMSFSVVTNAPITALVLGLKCAPIKVIVLPLFLGLAICTIPFYVFKWENIYHKLEKRLPGYIDE